MPMWKLSGPTCFREVNHEPVAIHDAKPSGSSGVDARASVACRNLHFDRSSDRRPAGNHDYALARAQPAHPGWRQCDSNHPEPGIIRFSAAGTVVRRAR